MEGHPLREDAAQITARRVAVEQEDFDAFGSVFRKRASHAQEPSLGIPAASHAPLSVLPNQIPGWHISTARSQFIVAV